MSQHGRGPKDVRVRRYPRWQHGKMRFVGDHVRGISPRLSLRSSEAQLSFAF